MEGVIINDVIRLSKSCLTLKDVKYICDCLIEELTKYDQTSG